MKQLVTTLNHNPPGFGHKLFIWEYLQIKYGDTHQVVLSDQIYYESGFITFPNTTFQHDEKMRAIKPDWNCIFNSISMPLHRPIKSLQFDKDLTNLVKTKCMDMTGVHIRRGDLIDDGSKKYKEWLESDNDNWRDAYLDDEYYIKICDRIVETNPREIFYLSTDAPLDEVKWFTDRYDVVISDNLLLHKKDRPKWGFDEIRNNPTAISPRAPQIDIHDITDILALSYSKRFIASNSLWSEFCSVYRKVPTIYPPNCFKIAPREGLFYTK
jgi:hypothetical protein